MATSDRFPQELGEWVVRMVGELVMDNDILAEAMKRVPFRTAASVK